HGAVDVALSPDLGFRGRRVQVSVHDVQPLHDHDDRAPRGVIETAAQRGVDPVVGRRPLGVAYGLIGRNWIIEYRGVASASHRGRAHAGSNHGAALVIRV